MRAPLALGFPASPLPQPLASLLIAPLLIASLLVLAPAVASGDDGGWNRFHGPDGRGYAPDASIPDSWTAEDYRWQLELPGNGIGSPVIKAGKAFVIAAEPDANRRLVLGIDLRSGRKLWQAAYPLRPHRLHARNTFASSTPYVDDSRVYVAWADPERVTVAALSHDGEELWAVDLGSWQSQHGFGTSPVVIDGRLIIFNSQQSRQLKEGEQPGVSRMVALDPATGKTLWSTELTSTNVCYGVPALYVTPSGERQIVGASTGDGLFGLDLETGELRWTHQVFKARCVSSPIVVGDLVLGTAGSGGGGNHLVAIRPAGLPSGSAGQEAEDNGGGEEGVGEVYRMQRLAPYVPTPAVVGNRLFLIDDKGIASCVEADSGEVLWSKRIGGNFGASPVVLGDKLLIISLNGEATVLRAADEYEELGQFELGGPASSTPVQATPAYAEGCLLLRVGNRLCCLEGSAGPSAAGR
ncbi:PQQ-binding-like beta-propeller repeat protein [Candidatus Laterigemmans baculatus]|uniref:PQQ-binding-like beta-propeller repeat protein n=1 Tax=Candidatus Laterigemmans baculatus TaxID=2770505 RepID=UPI0013DD3704|nr:PQQ-binding-like beta-propeller repeat protein [Candidatus Laterigemmans baculatus]